MLKLCCLDYTEGGERKENRCELFLRIKLIEKLGEKVGEMIIIKLRIKSFYRRVQTDGTCNTGEQKRERATIYTHILGD